MQEKYHRQYLNAKRRNIKWEFTFETWLEWWKNTGKLHQRGVRKDEYCMCRKGDKGPYSPDNVYCDTNSGNTRTANIGKPPIILTEEQRFKASSLGGKANSLIQKQKGKEKAIEKLKLIAHLDPNKRGFISKSCEILNLSHAQVRRLIDKYQSDMPT